MLVTLLYNLKGKMFIKAAKKRQISTVAGTVLLCFFVANSIAFGALRIMPLGDSITKGAGSSFDNGYRKPLYQKLTNDGYVINFIGTQTAGDFADPNHEGHSSYHAKDPIYNDIYDNVYDWLVANPPDIVLLHIGTNDISHSSEDPNEISDILDEIDRYEYDYDTEVLVFVARIVTFGGFEETVTTFNDGVQAMVMDRINDPNNPAYPDRIIPPNSIDMENALDYPADFYNSAHPNDSGYAKMADVWYNAIVNSLTNAKTLTISSTTGGSVTNPGEGDFLFFNDPNATITAMPDLYYHFDVWTGTAVDAGKVADPCAASTTVLVDANYTVVANFEAEPPDTTPPTPNPLVWQSIPTALNSTSITMTAATATDDHLPVEYYFECTTSGDANSGWQTNSTYVAQNLAPSTSYTFRVKARDNYLTPNETLFSAPESATTAEPNNTEILGDWVYGITHAKEEGPNRALIFFAHAENDGPVYIDSVTYGGQPMTPIIEYNAGTTDAQAYVAAFILDEAGIAAATGSTFEFQWNPPPLEQTKCSVFLSNVDQAALIGATGQDGGIDPTVPNPITAGPLSTIYGDMVFGIAMCGFEGDYTPNNGFIEGYQRDMPTSVCIGIYKSATGLDETPSVTYSGEYLVRQVIIGFVVQSTETDSTYTLTTSSTTGGSVTMPGEGNFQYLQDSNATVIATADPNYHFLFWTGTAVDAGKVANPYAANTIVLMDADYTVTANFEIDKKIIYGYVTEPDANIPVKDVIIAVNGGGGSDTTDANGYYQLSVDCGWSGTVEPNKTGYSFEPFYIDYNNITSDQNDNYAAALDTFIISGYVVESNTLTPLEDVILTPDNSGGPYTKKYYGGGSDITDSNGYYKVLVDYNFSGKITPYKYLWGFEPNSIIYSDVNEDIAEQQDYLGNQYEFIITGSIKNYCDAPIKNVFVEANNGASSYISDVNGNYEIWVNSNWSGTITPGKAHYTFDPNNRIYANVLGNITNHDYLADNIYDLDCDGSVGIEDVNVISENWLSVGEYIPGDLYKDDANTVNFFDFADFANVWGD
jgi:lysophospholipase L1-like esterase